MTDPSDQLPADRRSPGPGQVPVHQVDAQADEVRIAEGEPDLPDGFEERPLPATPAA